MPSKGELDQWINENPSVKRWLDALAPVTASKHGLLAHQYFRWLQGVQPFDSLEELLDRQARANVDVSNPRVRYVQLDWLQGYVRNFKKQDGGDPSLRYRKLMYNCVRSFYAHNRSPLPVDRRFRLLGKAYVMQSKLDVKSIRKLILSFGVRLRWKAIYMIMWQSAMDSERFHQYFNTWEMWSDQIHPQLEENISPIRLTFPSRKMNQQEYYTFIGAEAIDALKEYLQLRGPIREGEAIFITTNGRPVFKTELSKRWMEAAVRIGLVTQVMPKCPSCKGEMKRVRPTKKIHYLYRCTQCGHEQKPSRKRANTGQRYGYNLHEMRDVFRSTLEKIPKDMFNTTCAEFWMGHTIDELNYNKFYHDKDYVTEQYRIAEPYLNIISNWSPESQKRVEELQRQVHELTERLRKMETVYEERLKIKE